MFDYNPFVFYKYRFLKVFLYQNKRENCKKKKPNKAKQQQKQQKDRTKSTGL